VHRDLRPSPLSAVDENTTRTISQAPNRNLSARARRRCSYVAAEGWRYGAGDPFCAAPALAEGSYCAAHQALCRIEAGSPAADRAARALQRAAEAAPAPPAELAFLDLAAIPDLDGELDAQDIAACLDLPDRSEVES